MENQKKRFRFQNGIKRVDIPFLFSYSIPLKEQVKNEIEKAQKRYGTSKRAHWHYRIEDDYAIIYVTKD